MILSNLAHCVVPTLWFSSGCDDLNLLGVRQPTRSGCRHWWAHSALSMMTVNYFLSWGARFWQDYQVKKVGDYFQVVKHRNGNQWKIHHFVRWFFHWSLYLEGTFHCHVWLPEGEYWAYGIPKCIFFLLAALGVAYFCSWRCVLSSNRGIFSAPLPYFCEAFRDDFAALEKGGPRGPRYGEPWWAMEHGEMNPDWINQDRPVHSRGKALILSYLFPSGYVTLAEAEIFWEVYPSAV